jgi:hypothetical protein
MTMVSISPTPVQRFVDSNGNALSGGLLFTYQAGTTTKYPTYTDSTGNTQNTNPIVLNQRGEAPIWLVPNQAYKFVLATATDSDPPTSPIWTEDEIEATAAVTVGNMTDERGAGGTPGFAAGVDFVAGTTTALTLSNAYGSASNLWVVFDGTEQGADTFSLSGKVLTFNAPIPVGTSKVFVKGGTSLTVGAPANNSVSDASVVTGSKLYNRITDFVDVRDSPFNAKGDGVTDDAPAFQRACDFVSATGGRLYVPSGQYMFGTPVVVTANTQIFGEGTASIIKAKSAIASIFSVQGQSVSISNVLIDGNSYMASAGINNDGESYVSVNGCLIQNCGNGYYNTDTGTVTQSPQIFNNSFINNTTNIYLQGGAVNATIFNNYIYGGNGIVLDIATNHNEGTRVWGNTILPTVLNGTQGTGVVINAGLETQFFNNIIDQCIQFAVFISGATSAASVNFTKFTDNWFGFSGSPAANGIGVLAQGNISEITFRGNTFSVSPTYGLQFQNASTFIPSNVIVSENQFLNNVTGDVVVNSTAGFYRITDNIFTNSTHPYVEGNNGVAGFITGNSFPALPALSSASKCVFNYGVVTAATGSAVIASGTTSVTVTHGLSFTPNAADIQLVSTNISTSEPGEIAVTSVTSTQFTITCRNSPGASNLAIAWKADINR